MKHLLVSLVLASTLLFLYPMGYLQPQHLVHAPQAQPAFYFNDPTPLNGSYTYNAYDLAPTALITSDGNMWVAWESNRAGPFQIYYQIYNGITWTNPANLTSGGFASAPSLAQMNNGTVVVMWAGGTNGNDDHLYYRTFFSGVWKGTVRLTSGTTFTDELPKTVVTRDSSLWVFFERDTSTGPSTPPIRQIYYKTFTGNSWSPDTIMTTDPATNQQPSATIVRNGNIWVAWERNTTAGGNATVYIRSYNGTQWSGDTPVTSPGPSHSPDLVQDRNGTIWLFWSQPVHLNATLTQNSLLSRSSIDVGGTWSRVNNLTTWGDVNNPINNYSPSAVQGIDTTLYIFFATDVAEPYASYGIHIYYINSSPLTPVYGVAVTGMQVSPANSFPGGRIPGAFYPYGDTPVSIATISVTVSNYGDRNQIMTVTLQAHNQTTYTIGSRTGTLLAGLSAIFTFTWNVTGIPPARYTLTASIPTVAGESLGNDIGDTLNLKSGVIILYAGDVLRHGIVDIFDEAVMGHAWQSTINGPCVNGVGSGCNWNPDCDIKRHGIIDIFDEAVAGANWQKRI